MALNINAIKQLSKRKKTTLTVAVALTGLTILSVPTFAWLSSKRDAAVLAKVDATTTLYIYAGGQKEDASYIDLGDIFINPKYLRNNLSNIAFTHIHRINSALFILKWSICCNIHQECIKEIFPAKILSAFNMITWF